MAEVSAPSVHEDPITFIHCRDNRIIPYRTTRLNDGHNTCLECLNHRIGKWEERVRGQH